jgi:hypothetical protein
MMETRIKRSMTMVTDTKALANSRFDGVADIFSFHENVAQSFIKALADRDYEEAVALYRMVNINLRTPFPVSNKTNKIDELMWPIHCATEGGDLYILRWLIDNHFCATKFIVLEA